METALNTLIDTRTGRAIDLAMQKLEVTGRAYPLGSFVRVTHRFKCLGTQPMEAIYVAALPTGGTLRRFKVVGENFEVDSKMEPLLFGSRSPGVRVSVSWRSPPSISPR